MDDKFSFCTKAGLAVHELPLARRFAGGGVAIEQMPYIMAADVEAYLLRESGRTYDATKLAMEQATAEAIRRTQEPARTPPWRFEAGHFDALFKPAGMAARANKLLAEWLQATGKLYGKRDPESGFWAFGEHPAQNDTHTCVPVALTPIARDTAESLLREIVTAAGDGAFMYGHAKRPNELIDRARRLLSETIVSDKADNGKKGCHE